MIEDIRDDPLFLMVICLVSFLIVLTVVLLGEEEERHTGIRLHALQDSLSFAVSAMAGLLILATGIDEIDVVSAFFVLALMVLTSLGTLRESFDVLMERSPVDVKGVKNGSGERFWPRGRPTRVERL